MNKFRFWILCMFTCFSFVQAKQIKLIILDNSGTTNDCGVYSPTIAFIKLFQNWGIDITEEETRKPMGLFKKDHIREILKMDRVNHLFYQVHQKEWTEDDVEKMYEEFIPIQLACLLDYSELIPGTAETIAYLKEKYGVIIGLSTGFNKEMSEFMLEKAKEQGYHPDVFTSSSEVPKGRPYWYMVEENMRQARVFDPEEVLKVGDTKEDILEGKAMKKVSSSPTWTLGLTATGNYVGEKWDDLNSMQKDDFVHKTDSAAKILIDAGADFVAEDINFLPIIVELINEKLAKGEKPKEIPINYLN